MMRGDELMDVIGPRLVVHMLHHEVVAGCEDRIRIHIAHRAHQLAAARRRLRATSIARYMPLLMLPGDAFPWPAILNAVPWSGDVRTIGSPAVKFTPDSKASVLNGTSP